MASRRRRVSKPDATQDVLFSEQQTETPAVESLPARNGDILNVRYGGAKISVGNYSTVEVDGATMTRELVEGEDVGQVFDEVYNFLRARCEAEALGKVKFWTNEVGGRGK